MFLTVCSGAYLKKKINNENTTMPLNKENMHMLRDFL